MSHLTVHTVKINLHLPVSSLGFKQSVPETMSAALFQKLITCFTRPSKANYKHKTDSFSSYYDYYDSEKYYDDDDELDQAANDIIATLLDAETDGAALQKQIDDIISIHTAPPDRRSNGGTSKTSLKKKWIRRLARAIFQRLEKILARVLEAENSNSNSNDYTKNNHDHHHHHPKLGRAMQKAMERAAAEAKVVLKGIPDLPRNHPVCCSLIALGILVLLLPWALEALGFAELGPVEGTE